MHFLSRGCYKHARAMNIIRWLCTAFCLFCLLFSQPSSAQEGSVEYKIKAGYLYNFTKFISWPEDNSETFNLCILGTDPFGDLIDPIEQRSAFEHPIRLHRLNDASAFASGNPPRCHILFVSAAVKSIPKLQDRTLTVGESLDFARRGGMIGFINKDGKIKLQINLATVRQSALKISAKLLEVSEIIEDSKP